MGQWAGLRTQPLIAIDATYSVGRALTGVGVYSQRLMRGLAEGHPEAGYRWCYRPHRFVAGLKDARPVNASPWPLFEKWAPGCDVFHGLNQRLPEKGVKRAVCTFHDLFVISSSEYSTAEFRARFTEQAKQAAARADLIIAVSAFTAGQIEALLGVARSRIRVVHHGVDLPKRVETVRKAAILTVGAFQYRKNTARLVEAFEQIDAPEWRLIIAGSAGHGSTEILARIERSPKRWAIDLVGFVTDAEREQLYREAGIFAFPSLDEGFGMPVLEAMSYGVPVVTSNCSSLPEVAGDAAVLVDPRDASALAGALQGLIDDTDLRQRLSAAGIERARRFPWGKAVDETWRVYGELLSAR